MRHHVLLLIKRILPQRIITLLLFLCNSPRMLELRETQRILNSATDTPSHLDCSLLETLQLEYSPPPEYGYDAQSLEARGMTRAMQLLEYPEARESNSFLELGCWDGMVSFGLCRQGKRAVAIDNRNQGFEERAALEGVSFHQMDAADLQFEDESFDFVFCYDAFEHFTSPERVLDEAVRIVRKGGYIYLNFGPLYYSPFGAHAYRSITVPYCQFLFPKDLINSFIDENGLNPIDFSEMNSWPLNSYRELWSKNSQVLKVLEYHEETDLSHLNLIRSYPSCFKSKSEILENYFVSSITILFQKIDPKYS